MLRCEDCGLIFVYPQPSEDELCSIYDIKAGYFRSTDSDLSASSSIRSHFVNNLFSKFSPVGNRLLDVGCANGRDIWHLREMGWRVAGTEVNDGVIEIARAHGLDVYKGELEESPFGDGSFDCIRLGQVLEHLRTPRRSLEKAWRLLGPGGLVCITVPNANSGFALATRRMCNFVGASWPHSEAPYHLFEFGRTNLSRLLESTGFRVVHTEYCGRRRFLYTVGTLDAFAELKKTFKLGTRSEKLLQLLRHTPHLLAATSVLTPFFVLGSAYDRLWRQRHALCLVARRDS